MLMPQICKTIESAVKTAMKLPDSKHHKPVKVDMHCWFFGFQFLALKLRDIFEMTHGTSDLLFSLAQGGYQAQPPRPPPPIYKPTYSTSASGYVTFDNNQVIPANVHSFIFAPCTVYVNE